MKGICANLTTLFLSAAALAAALVSLNVAAGLVTVSLPVVVNALALGALISVGACVLTTLFGRSHRHVFCYAFSMAFATIAFLFTVAHFNISHEMLIAYGSAGALGFGAGIVGSGLSRLIHGQP